MIILIIGTRSEAIKFSTIIRECERRNLPFKILNTGQHGQEEMIKWMNKLKLPEPEINLGTSLRKLWTRKGVFGSLQIFSYWSSTTFLKLISVFRKEKPKIVFYQGDTIAVPMTALAARMSSKGILLAHRESGMRSHRLLEPVPEEFNRRLADKFTDIHFCPVKSAVRNLLKEKARGEIHYVGDPIVEIVEYVLKKFKKPRKFRKYKDFVAVSIHRFENINNKLKMLNLFKVLENCPFKVLFPLNENTRRKFERYKLLEKMENLNHVNITNPIPYVEWINIVKNAKAIITDSGGLQEEAHVMKIPCILTRNVSEWEELVDAGVSVLTGFNIEKILGCLEDVKNKGSFYKKVKKTKCLLGDGKATERIVDILEEKLRV
jgi:UDP-N-acetylglucosamine 2-epimerase (non-hydrolysing)